MNAGTNKKGISIQLPTKPYLKKYIQAQYGNPVSFTTRNIFGMTVALSLKKPLRNHEAPTAKKLRFDAFTSNITIKAAPSFLNHYDYNLAISEDQALTVNKLFEAKFERDLYQWCANLHIIGIETKDALAAFCKVYGIEIEEDIAFEALKKKEYRYRKEIEKKSADLSRDRTKDFIKKFLLETLAAGATN